ASCLLIFVSPSVSTLCTAAPRPPALSSAGPQHWNDFLPKTFQPFCGFEERRNSSRRLSGKQEAAGKTVEKRPIGGDRRQQKRSWEDGTRRPWHTPLLSTGYDTGGITECAFTAALNQSQNFGAGVLSRLQLRHRYPLLH